jgi:restriction endonuclease S subunit
VVKTSALKGGVFDPSECKPIVQADLARATTPLRRDTLLISRMNTPDLVGEVGYVDRAYDWLYLPDRIWMTHMRSPDCVCVRWLGYLLCSVPYKRLIGDTATGTSGSMKNIAKSALLGLPVRFPEVDEQRAIAAGLADIDAEISAIESRLTKARALKQAMAQALLTGLIRLVEPTP